MKETSSIVVRAITTLWENAFLSIFCSLVWLFLTLLIVPGPPATIAIYSMAWRVVSREPLIDFSDYLKDILKYFGVGWRWAAVNLPVLIILLVDIRTLPNLLPPFIAATTQVFTYVILAMWLVLNWLALAFLFQQKEVSLSQAFRNAGVMLLNHPFYTLIVVIITVVLLWLSLLMVIVNLLFGPMFIGLVATIAVDDRLALFRESQKAKSLTN
jgi:uncharacterized membrane protein YesL